MQVRTTTQHLPWFDDDELASHPRASPSNWPLGSGLLVTARSGVAVTKSTLGNLLCAYPAATISHGQRRRGRKAGAVGNRERDVRQFGSGISVR